MARMSVDLPQPFGPENCDMLTNADAEITLCRTTRSPRAMLTARISRKVCELISLSLISRCPAGPHLLD